MYTFTCSPSIAQWGQVAVGETWLDPRGTNVKLVTKKKSSLWAHSNVNLMEGTHIKADKQLECYYGTGRGPGDRKGEEKKHPFSPMPANKKRSGLLLYLWICFRQKYGKVNRDAKQD